MFIRTVNAVGLKSIRDFLTLNEKNSTGYYMPEQLNAWALDAEFQMGEGNPPTIELKHWQSVCGFTVDFTVPDEGIDAVPFVEAED